MSNPKKSRKKLEHRVLAEGEVTGHFHALDAGTLYSMPDGTLEVELEKPGTVRHQEHGPVTIPPGDYTRNIVREVNEDEEIRRVVD